MNNIITFVSVEGGGAGGGRGGSNNYISDFERNGWSESCTFGQQVSVNVPLPPSWGVGCRDVSHDERKPSLKNAGSPVVLFHGSEPAVKTICAHLWFWSQTWTQSSEVDSGPCCFCHIIFTGGRVQRYSEDKLLEESSSCAHFLERWHPVLVQEFVFLTFLSEKPRSDSETVRHF